MIIQNKSNRFKTFTFIFFFDEKAYPIETNVYARCLSNNRTAEDEFFVAKTQIFIYKNKNATYVSLDKMLVYMYNSCIIDTQQSECNSMLENYAAQNEDSRKKIRRQLYSNFIEDTAYPNPIIAQEKISGEIFIFDTLSFARDFLVEQMLYYESKNKKP